MYFENRYFGNCRVNSNLHVRICDSALSHDIFPGDYQRMNNGEMCPVKWMAVECLTDGRYTLATDTVIKPLLISVTG